MKSNSILNEFNISFISLLILDILKISVFILSAWKFFNVFFNLLAVIPYSQLSIFNVDLFEILKVYIELFLLLLKL